MEAKTVFCQRLKKDITEAACAELICALEQSRDIQACRECDQGKALMRLCPYQRRYETIATQGEEILRATLRYLCPHYKASARFGFAFLDAVARARHGWMEGAASLCEAARRAGLSVSERPWAVVRDRALADFIL